MSKLHRVFVYGTLKRGQPNHYLVTDRNNGEAEFQSEGSTVDAYPLVVASRYNVPYLLDAKGTGKRIYGEVYSLDDKMLNAMDVLEKHPDWYTRLEIPIDIGGQPRGQQLDCWTYIMLNYKQALLKSPMIDNYDSKSSMTGAYVLPGERSETSQEWREAVKDK